MPSDIKILSVDPGYDRCGLALIEKSNSKNILIDSMCVETKKTDSHALRLLAVGTEFSKWIKKHKPDHIALESIFFEKNQKTAMKIGEVRGVLIYEAVRNNIPIHEFTPPQIKLAVAGHGGADKKDVIAMMVHLIKIDKKIKHDDEYDAIAVGLTCSAHLKMSQYKSV